VINNKNGGGARMLFWGEMTMKIEVSAKENENRLLLCKGMIQEFIIARMPILVENSASDHGETI